MSQRAMVVYCGLLMSLSAFLVDITLPAFPVMVKEFSSPYSYVQWTLTMYMIAAGSGQLLWGSVSDRFGRKPVLFFGLSLLLVGLLLAFLAPTIVLLIAARALQGLGAASAIVCSRAILRDLFSGRELARNMAMASAVFAIGPILAPLLGAVMIELAGWRSVFFGLACLTLALIAMLGSFEETSRFKDGQALRLGRIRSNLVALFTHPQSRFFLLTAMIAMAFMLIILTGMAPFYESEFGITGILFAALFAIHGFFIIAGQMLSRRLIPTIGIVPTIVIASTIMALMSGLLLALTASDMLMVFMVPVIVGFANSSFLVIYANTTSLVLDPHEDKAGFAVSVYGFATQMGGAAIVSVLVLFSNGQAFGMSVQMFTLSLVILLALVGWSARNKPVRES
jgi:DHA1 family bicyclomycin/chloramphenicol resistance-like MFS transporter